MYSTLYKYLALHKNLNIPGIGNFTIEETPATLAFADKQLHAPVTNIKFTQAVHSTNNHFYTFLSREWGVDKVIAIRMYKDGVEEILDKLKKLGICELPGIGVIHKTTDDQFGFKAAEAMHFYTSLPAERVLRKNVQHTVLVGEQEHLKTHTLAEEPTDHVLYEEEQTKDKWWIYVLILALLAVIMIVYYYVAM